MCNSDLNELWLNSAFSDKMLKNLQYAQPRAKIKEEF